MQKVTKAKGKSEAAQYKHFTHISAKAGKARNDLKATQMELHDLPMNIELLSKVALL